MKLSSCAGEKIEMKKLLIMASLFWPQKNSGGPPISIMNVVQAIKDNFDIYIISKNHEIGEKESLPAVKNGWNQFEFGKVYYTEFGEHTFSNITKLIIKIKPDIIYQNSFFSQDDMLPVVLYKKKYPDLKVIVAPRGELYPERLKRGKTKKYIYGWGLRTAGLLKDIYFQGTGEDECNQIKNFLSVPENRLYNIQNISAIGHKSTNIEKQRNEIRLVYIARIHPSKNTLKAIEFLKNVKGNVIFDIYGSIEDKEYWKKCLEAIDNLPDNIKVTYRGIIEHDKVADTLARYHAYYMPTKGENFGHSIVESMLVGRIVVISDQTPWSDVNRHGGYAIPLSDEKGYIETICHLCSIGQCEFDDRCKKINTFIQNNLNIQETINKYIEAFDCND